MGAKRKTQQQVPRKKHFNYFRTTSRAHAALQHTIHALRSTLDHFCSLQPFLKPCELVANPFLVQVRILVGFHRILVVLGRVSGAFGSCSYFRSEVCGFARICVPVCVPSHIVQQVVRFGAHGQELMEQCYSCNHYCSNGWRSSCSLENKG